MLEVLCLNNLLIIGKLKRPSSCDFKNLPFIAVIFTLPAGDEERFHD